MSDALDGTAEMIPDLVGLLTQRSPDRNIAEWERRYNRMSMAELAEAHAHLAGWQAYLGARPMTVNRALLKRMAEDKKGGL